MGEPRIRPDTAVTRMATGSSASHAQLSPSSFPGPVRFHGLYGLENSATVYAPTA